MGIDVCIRVGRRIRVFRTERGISQIILADASGIDRTNLSRIENGRAEAGLRTLYRIATALNVRLADLLQDVD